MKKAIPIITSLLFIFCSLVDGKKTVTNTNQKLKPTKKHPKFSEYWYAGKAEITSYKLTQNRYGELHQGTAVNIFVTEDFLPEKQVKADNQNKKNIPVLVDCAYFGVCRDIHIDIAYPCITDVTFSLSKSFPLAYARIGIRYTKVDDDDTMFVYHKINYNNKIGAALGLKFLKHFTPDYMSNKYLDKQADFCNTLGVTPSKTVLFGIDYNTKFPQYNRGGKTNRLSFHKQYIKGLDIASTK